MIKLNITLIILNLFANLLFAQKESNTWYFGYNAGVDFNSGTPVSIGGGAINQGEGCASISDFNGALLFYTNGVLVWDRNHATMPNGYQLAGGGSSSQSALIVPMPGNNFQYYIFTVQELGTSNNLSYSIVDMSLNNGNGDVTVKNNFLFSPVTEKLSGVKHSNNNDYWIMAHGIGNSEFYAYQVAISGVNLTPVISSVGASITTGSNVIGCMKFSPDGSKLAFAAYDSNYVDLFDFNSTTGIVSNEKYLALPTIYRSAYGIEFSATGTYLYASNTAPSTLFQWDVSSDSAAVINASRQQIGSASTIIGSIQLAPDRKIYVAKKYSGYLGAINDPDSVGILCNYNDSALSLDSNLSVFGLPNFISSFFNTTGLQENFTPPQLLIYPNPFISEISIRIQKPNFRNLNFFIIDILGQTVFKKNKNNFSNDWTAIDLNFLSKGIYLLDVNIDGASTVHKILKE